MSRRRAVIALVVLALMVGACGGDDERTTTGRTPSGDASPRSTNPSSGVDGLPPGFVECMAEQGYEVKSSADIHSAPADVLQACFGH